MYKELKDKSIFICNSNNYNNIPIGTKQILFDDEFNKTINFLPYGLTHLKFGKKYNKKLKENLFPQSLCDSHPLDEVAFATSVFSKQKLATPVRRYYFPQTLKTIILGNNFNQPITSLLTLNIKIIIIRNYHIEYYYNGVNHKFPNNQENIDMLLSFNPSFCKIKIM